jgi:hypothetical protein
VVPIIWTALRKFKTGRAGPVRAGGGAAAFLALLAVAPPPAAAERAAPACRLEHAGLTIEVRHTPPTADWEPTLELTVLEGALPLTRMVAPEPAAVDACSLAEGAAPEAFALVVRLAGTPGAGSRLRIFDWRDGRLEERAGR